jgi:hypothetical protein
MILDKLLEKKDILLYLKTRIEMLEKNKKSVMDLEPKKRAMMFERFDGRIKELTLLIKVVHSNEVKIMSKQYWTDAAIKNDTNN